MLVLGRADRWPCDHDWRWLRAYNPDGPCGAGLILTTDRASEAQVFPSVEVAEAVWMQQHPQVRRRSDGGPNRPFTAYNVVFVPADDAVALEAIADRITAASAA